MLETTSNLAELGRCLFDESNDGLLIFDPRDGLRIVDVNPHLQRLTRLSITELRELSVTDLIDSSDSDILQGLFEACSTTRVFHSRENFRLRISGDEWLDVNITVSRLHTEPDVLGAIAIRDISRRCAIEAQLRQSQSALQDALARSSSALTDRTAELGETEQRYRGLFNGSSDAICVFTADGTLEQMNAAATTLLGGLAGDSIRDLFADAAEEQRFRSLLTHEKQLDGIRFRLKRVKGELFDALVSANTLQSDDAAPGYQLIVRDISELIALQDRLRTTEKMEAIGRMAGGIAHDFNNFLSVVVLGAELVKPHGDMHPSIEKGISLILDAAGSASSMTSQIQLFSAASVRRDSVADARDVLLKARTVLDALTPPNVELVLDVATELGSVGVDAAQLEQILINLVQNAGYAMPQGGQVTIVASNVEVGTDMCETVGLDRCGIYVRLKVKDTGVGMDESTLDRIFEPFFTTKPRGKGTGLGLSIVYGMVQQCGGAIDVTSAMGAGTAFDLYLPVAAGTESLGAAIDDGPGNLQGNETLLVVEDDSMIRELVAAFLGGLGYTVHTAEDGNQALATLSDLSDVDLVVTDLIMPRMSGRDLIATIQDMHPNIAFVAMSGYPGDSSGISVPLLPKPFAPAELGSLIRNVLDLRRA